MLSDALRYPVAGEGWIRTVLIGGLLSLLSVFVLPVFLLQGYYVRVLRGVTTGDPAPPRFDEWVELLVDGLKFLVINLLVVAVLAVSFAVVGIAFGAGSIIAGGLLAEPGSAGPVGVLGVVGAVVFGAVFLLVGYVAPGMFANFAREDSLLAALDVSTVLAGTMTVEYFIGWVLALVVGIVLGTVASLLSVVVVGIFGLFYVQVATYYLFGRGFADGLAAGNEGDAKSVAY